MTDYTIQLHKGDLPNDVTFNGDIAVDTEAMGLQNIRDRLCVIQLSDGNGVAHLVQLEKDKYDAPNLKRILADTKTLKIFHYARFDVAIMKYYLGIDCAPVFCTRTASKLARTYTDRHGLRECLRDLLGVDISKHQQSSDWGAEELTEAQQLYAATDVFHLNALKDKLVDMLAREGRTELAQKCFDFLPARAELDLSGWNNVDIFEH